MDSILLFVMKILKTIKEHGLISILKCLSKFCDSSYKIIQLSHQLVFIYNGHWQIKKVIDGIFQFKFSGACFAAPWYAFYWQHVIVIEICLNYLYYCTEIVMICQNVYWVTICCCKLHLHFRFGIQFTKGIHRYLKIFFFHHYISR